MKLKNIFIKKALHFILIALLNLLFTNPSFGQRTCGSYEAQQELFKKYPYLKEKKRELDSISKLREIEIQNGTFKVNTVYTIPVVIHVLYNTNAENIADEVINSQLTALNRDFNLLNADAANIPAEFSSVASNFEINFCLAALDPSGNPTSGVERRQTTVDTFFSSQNNAKSYSLGGLDAWDKNKYLNLWVTPTLKSGPSGNFLLGYSTFPGDPANFDGVVILASGFGDKTIFNSPLISNTFNRGRTAVHEIGHWLNLEHIWGNALCGDDGVSDTPIHDDKNYGCPTYPFSSDCGGTTHNEMTMNYMDYVDDGCMYMFTAGQKTRSIASITTSRSSLFINQPICPQNFFVTSFNGVNFGYYKANSIESTDIINATEQNIYKGGSNVILKPGFKATSGSFLEVKIGSCCIL